MGRRRRQGAWGAEGHIPVALESRMMLDGMTDIIQAPPGMTSGTTPVTTTTATPSGASTVSASLTAFIDQFRNFISTHPDATAEEDIAFLMSNSGLTETQIQSLFTITDSNLPIYDAQYVPSSVPPAVPLSTPPAVPNVGPLQQVIVTRISTTVDARQGARFNPAADTYERYVNFSKVTIKETTYRFVDPVEYAAYKNLLDVSNREMFRLQRAIDRLQRFQDLCGTAFLSLSIPAGMNPITAPTIVLNQDLWNSGQQVLANLREMQMWEAKHWSRLKTQVDTGAGLTWRETTVSSQVPEGTGSWEVSNGLIQTAVWAEWSQENGYGLNPPDIFWVDDAWSHYGTKADMPEWLATLYDQSNPGGGMW